MDPLLFINIGLLVASAGAAAIAWWRAIAAGRESADAKRAADAALEAQEAAAKALEESNEISRAAHRLVEDREARATERHRVEWVPHWDWETGRWILGSHGPDIALKVRLHVESPAVGRVVEESDEVRPGRGLAVEFPMYAGQGGQPRVVWSVDWETPLGTVRSVDGIWPD